MIDVTTENLITLAEAAKLVPGRHGRGVHVASVYRWAMTGCRGTKLETVAVGGARLTSREAVARFAARCSGHPEIPPPRPKQERERAAHRAGRELAALGVG